MIARLSGRLSALLLAPALIATGCGPDPTPRLLAEGGSPPAFEAALTIRPRSGLVVVPVRIGGREVGFLLDSGAPTAIAPALRRELGLATQTRTRAADARRAEVEVDVVRLPEVRVADVPFAGIAAVVLDVTSVPELACLGVEGLLGANLMRQAAWEIDMSAGRVRLASDLRRLGVPAGAPSARFITFDSGSPVLRPLLDGEPVEDMVLDTGANVAFVAPPTVLPPEAAGRTVEVVGTSGAAALGYGSFAGTSRFGRVERIDIGELTVRDQVVEFRDEASLLGTRFLRDYLVTIDWRSRRVWFAPSAAPAPPAPASGFGFDVVLRDELLTVSAVIVGSPAWEAGMRPGQAILAVDGESLSPLELERYCAIMERGLGPAGAPAIRVRWRAEGGARSVELERIEVTLG